MEWELGIDTEECGDKMILKRAEGSISSIVSVDVFFVENCCECGNGWGEQGSMHGRDSVATSGGILFQGIAGGENWCEFW